MTTSKVLVGATGLLAVALATPGCATKKFVRTQVGTVDQRVSEVDKKQTQALANLEGKETKDVSRVEERAMTAENKATDAARAAQQADQRAQQAGDAARNATDLAQQAQNRINEVSQVVQNIDTYRLVTSQDVLFGFNKAILTRDGKAKLDQLAQQAASTPRAVVEVEGFTDRSGPRDYNLALSRRRADTVVRYLVDHGVALRRIHMIGLGEVTNETMTMAQGGTVGQMPSNNMAAGQTTGQTATGETAQNQNTRTSTGRLTRKEMRRVVVNLYAPETTLSASSNMPQSQQMNQPNTTGSTSSTTQTQGTGTQTDNTAPSPR